MDYTTHVSWPTKRPDFWKTWGLLACLIFTIVGPLCYVAEITKSVAKNGLQEAEFPEFSFKNCCSENVLLWLCYISLGVPLFVIGIAFAVLGWQSFGQLFCSLATLSYFVYFPAFLICGASEREFPLVCSTFFKLPFSHLAEYYNLVLIYMFWQGAVSAVTFMPAILVGVGICIAALKFSLISMALVCIFFLLLLVVLLAAQSYVFIAMASLVGDYMRNHKNELFEKDILEEKAFLMPGSLEE